MNYEYSHANKQEHRGTNKNSVTQRTKETIKRSRVERKQTPTTEMS